MSVLLLVMLVGAAVALALGVRGRRRVGRVPLVAEGVMLVAMLDVHVPALGVVPAPFWALLLGGCAMGTAVLDRVQLQRRAPGGDHLHALGMLLGSVFVLLGSPGHVGGAGAEGVPGGHHHAVLLLPVAAAVLVHAGAVLWSVSGHRVPRAESARRVASLVSVLAMGAMAVVH